MFEVGPLTSEGRRFVLAEVPPGTVALLGILAVLLGATRSEALASLLGRYFDQPTKKAGGKEREAGTR